MLVCEADETGLGCKVLFALLASVCGGVRRVDRGESGAPRAGAWGLPLTPLYGNMCSFA